VTLTDYGVESFDVTRAPDAVVDGPRESRQPRGRGLHLVRRMVDAVHYEYDAGRRVSRTTFRLTVDGLARRAAAPG
jgi:anti-sigma regulatory factor (Ser/Thr protein kinase)